jgi:cytochrome c biogenesis protein CcmG/thiol:disulfide interchange protein DsbE
LTRSSRDSRREAARARDRAAARPGWLLPAIAALVIVLAAVAAIVLSNLGGSGGGSSDLPSDVPSASVPDGAGPVITGTSLPPLESPTNDAAVGMIIPTVTAPGGSIALDGTAKILLFLAHWCPHCQAEVPLVQAWVDGGSLPPSVELISVSTAIDPARPNYPPDAWLEREGWTAPVIVDETGSVGDAYGLTAFPYWVFVDAAGQVVGRITGELTTEQLDTIAADLAG